MKFHAVLDIQLHPGISDPQGSTIERALPTLGFEGVTNVRSGKSIHLDLDAEDAVAAQARLQDMCDRFLTNPVIEGATISLVEAEI